jgi:hypothetical protein
MERSHCSSLLYSPTPLEHSSPRARAAGDLSARITELTHALHATLEPVDHAISVALLSDPADMSKRFALVVIPDELSDDDLTRVERNVASETRRSTGFPCEVLLFTWDEYEEREDWELGIPFTAWPTAIQVLGPPLLATASLP